MADLHCPICLERIPAAKLNWRCQCPNSTNHDTLPKTLSEIPDKGIPCKIENCHRQLVTLGVQGCQHSLPHPVLTRPEEVHSSLVIGLGSKNQGSVAKNVVLSGFIQILKDNKTKISDTQWIYQSKAGEGTWNSETTSLPMRWDQGDGLIFSLCSTRDQKIKGMIVLAGCHFTGDFSDTLQPINSSKCTHKGSTPTKNLTSSNAIILAIQATDLQDKEGRETVKSQMQFLSEDLNPKKQHFGLVKPPKPLYIALIDPNGNYIVELGGNPVQPGTPREDTHKRDEILNGYVIKNTKLDLLCEPLEGNLKPLYLPRPFSGKLDGLAPWCDEVADYFSPVR